MDQSVRIKLSVMMFLQYFVWGAWGVAIGTYLLSLPTEGGLNFSGNLTGWIGAAIPIGAMISPLFIGLIADRLFATENVLAVLNDCLMPVSHRGIHGGLMSEISGGPTRRLHSRGADGPSALD